MTENFNYLFQYLEREDIIVDKAEFLFQIQSHPDYPSILAIADTLTFFNIGNVVVRIDKAGIELGPERFVVLLTEENNKSSHDPKLYFVEQVSDDRYFCTKDKMRNEITKSELESRWKGIVLLIEKNETECTTNAKRNNLFWVLPSLCIGLFLSIQFMSEEELQTKLFFIYPIIGILFSVAALKDLFGTKSKLINSFCNITSTASCSSVTGSKKWKVFSFVDLRSLSIVFYTSQLVALFLFLFSNSVYEYFYIQKILLFCAIPVIVLSVYYQKFIEKKWCPICLAIISILILELTTLLLFQENSYVISVKSVVFFGFVFFDTVFIWSLLKATLEKQKELKEFQLTGNRFMRNYEVFKNTLLAKSSIDLPSSPIILGNKESDTEITIITSPFCGHCENAHKILDKILNASPDNLKIKLIFNAIIDTLDEEKKFFFRILMSIYLTKGDSSFLEALNYWFETRNLKDWIKRYEVAFDSEQIDSIYKEQNNWCKNNDFNFTPVIFINGFEYPKVYSKESLEFFVNELVEDDFFELV